MCVFSTSKTMDFANDTFYIVNWKFQIGFKENSTVNLRSISYLSKMAHSLPPWEVGFLSPMCCFCILIKNYLFRCACFRMSIIMQNWRTCITGANILPTLHNSMNNILIVSMIWLRRWGGICCYDVHTKFHKKPSIDSEVHEYTMK